MIKVKRALISVSDKTGLLEFARGLQSFGVEIISTGGTAKLLKKGGVSVTEVSDYTGFPEMLDGRVKTLHPKVHGGLLAVRDKKEHMEQIKKHDIKPIDMAVINLYPFEKVVGKKNVTVEEAIENLDIGGPAMLRSAAKNYTSVAVVCNPARYKAILKELDTNSGMLANSVLISLAIETFAKTAHYDSIIYNFLNSRLKSEEFSRLPKDISLRFSKIQDLRYGENPHQSAAFYRDLDDDSGLSGIKQLHGKELSFNNLLDLNAAISFVKDFKNPAAVIVKHNNPTGVAEDRVLVEAYKKAWACDSISAFGGIIGLNKKVDLKTAQQIIKSGFMECIIAPGFAPQAFKALSKKKNLRLVEIVLKDIKSPRFDFKKVYGGLLLQEADVKAVNPSEFKVVTKVKPAKAQLPSMVFGWDVIRNIKSNAIILVKGTKTVGIGCGQTSRIDSVASAITRAGRNAKNSVLISDAFIPKTDNVKLAAKAGVKAIIQTGGSIADNDVIKEADKAKIAMVLTGIRHFKH